MAKPKITKRSRRPVAQWENPRAVKVDKRKNGKKTAIKSMSGISRDELSTLPNLRIGREWYFKIEYGYVDLYFVNGAVRTANLPSVKVRLGRWTDSGFLADETLTGEQWQAIANRMWPKHPGNTDTQQIQKQINSAVLKHYQDRYPRATAQILAVIQ